MQRTPIEPIHRDVGQTRRRIDRITTSEQPIHSTRSASAATMIPAIAKDLDGRDALCRTVSVRRKLGKFVGLPGSIHYADFEVNPWCLIARGCGCHEPSQLRLGRPVHNTLTAILHTNVSAPRRKDFVNEFSTISSIQPLRDPATTRLFSYGRFSSNVENLWHDRHLLIGISVNPGFVLTR